MSNTREIDARIAVRLMGFVWYAMPSGTYVCAPPKNFTSAFMESHGVVQCADPLYYPANFAKCDLLSVPRYTEEPGPDYSVLRRLRVKCVRDNDQALLHRFFDALKAIWSLRFDEHSQPGIVMAHTPASLAVLYEPGDYSRAADTALGGSIAESNRPRDKDVPAGSTAQAAVPREGDTRCS